MTIKKLVMILFVLGVLIVGAIVFFVTLEKEKEKVSIESFLIDKMLELINQPYTKEGNLNELSHMIFQYCMKMSNKKVKYEEVINPSFVMQNPSLLKYTAIFSSIKDVINELNRTKKQLIPIGKEKTIIRDSFYSVTGYAIEEINKF